MDLSKTFRAGLFGLACALAAVPATLPTQANAEILRVMKGSASSSLKVPMNRAVVVESDVPFGELSVANPGIADIATLSDRTIYVLGKAPGRTTLTLLGPDGRLITNVDVQVSPDIAEFKERLGQILPGEAIEVRTANDGIVLSGTVSSIARLDRALDLAERYAPGRVSNLMTVGGTQQVMLKVRFAEMQRSVSKNLTSSLAFQADGGNIGSVGGSQVFSSGSNLINLFDGDPTTNVSSSNNRAGAMTIGLSAGGLEFAVLLEALESKGVVRTLAEPNLTALSGQYAHFLAGGEYPIPVVDNNGNSAIEYKPFGVLLGFTPRVVEDDIINLEVKAEVSAIDTTVSISNGGFSINAFSVRRSSTTVELRDGQSFAIAGLLQDDFNDLSAQVPWLGDIPVLGALFRSADYSRNQSELVIIITAHLVSPTRGEALALPTDRIKIPTERELFLLGKVTGKNKPRGAAGEVASQDFTGSYGYVME